MITQQQADAVIVAAFGERAGEESYVLNSPAARLALQAAFGDVPRQFPAVESSNRKRWFEILRELTFAIQSDPEKVSPERREE